MFSFWSANKIDKIDKFKGSWENDLKFNDTDNEDEDDLFGEYSNATIVVNKTQSKRDRSKEKYDFSKPRPLKNTDEDTETTRFFEKGPKPGHKYVADYYCSLSLAELNEVLMEIKSSFENQVKRIKENYNEEREIVEYAIRVRKGDS
ncbi:hypothetical protein MHBO_004432 [Bonamia ostreae]|uniref:SARAH domain-containing protein n=1 Tax=Bonamia ostreae TaxID=126728 RepID=A0ABV2ATA2_9EUKA